MNAQDFAAFGQASLEKNIRLSHIALGGVERFVNLQLEMVRELLADNTATVRALSDVKDMQSLMALQQQIAQPAVDKAMSVARHVYQAATSTQAELSQFVEEQVSDFNKTLVDTLDKAVKQAPAGSDIVVSAMKNAVATAASAYDTVSRTAKKVSSDFAEAGAAAAESSAKVASGVAKATVRKANPAASVQ